MPFNPKKFEEIYEDIKNYILGYPNCNLTDFSSASNLNVLVSAICDVLEEFYVDAAIGWEMIVKDKLYEIFSDLERKEDTNATGTVVFSRSTNATEDYIIPSGTIVENTNGVQFETTEEGEILTGTTSSSAVSIRALVPGTSGNVASGTITTIVTLPVGVQFVNNSAATTGGYDLESDASFDARFRDYIKSLAGGTSLALKSASESVIGVESAYVRENYPSTGTVTIYIDDGSGSSTSTLNNAVLNHLEGSGTESDPGHRPAGIALSIDSITGVTINVEADIRINIYATWETVKEQCNELISEYINSLDQEEDVIWSRIVDVIHDNPDVEEVDVTTPVTNTTIDAGEVAKIGTITLNQVT